MAAVEQTSSYDVFTGETWLRVVRRRDRFGLTAPSAPMLWLAQCSAGETGSWN